MNKKYQIKASLFEWTGKGAWFFIRIEKEIADNIKENFGMYTRGWGSLPVNVSVGKSNWKTSIFPDKQTYLLPIKSQIRKHENLKEADLINLEIEISVEKIEIKPPPIS